MFLRPVARAIAKHFAPAFIFVALSTGYAWSQTDYLTFTGVWSTVPLTGLATPRGVVGDTSGNLYIADAGLSSVVKLAPDGTQSTVGSGLSSPTSVAVDTAGDVYVTSSADSKVYEITPGGTQTAVGSGWSTPVSVAVSTSGTVWVADDSGLSSVTAGTPALVVSGSGLRGIFIDTGGNVYYGDNTNQEVYELAGGAGSPAGHNQATHSDGLYVDAEGSVFVAQGDTGVLRSDDSGNDYTVFGDTLISFGVWGDSHQNLYIADAAGLVRKLALGAVDFGSVNVCPQGATATPCSSSVTLNFALDSSVSSSQVMSGVSQGVPDFDYQLTGDGCTGNTNVGGACTETVTFAPLAAGLRTGDVEAVGNSFYNGFAPPAGTHPRVSHTVHPHDEPPGTLLASVPLHGIGLAPLSSFSSAPIQSGIFLTMPDPYPYNVTVSSNEDYYVTDQHNCIVQETPQGSNSTNTVAGTVCGPAAGDGGPATSAVLSNPVRTAMDGAGNLYIVDDGSRTVREVDALTGLISTVAGNGTNGNTGDGGPALSASFKDPLAIALDPQGNGYIADCESNVVRMVNGVTGIISTIAGNGTPGYSGDAGAATSAELDCPDALALDNAGNLFIADDSNNIIRKVVLSTGVITTVAGTGTAGYSGDGGAATSAQINDPEGIAVDPAGNLYIADSQNFVVRKVDVNTGMIATVAGVHSTTESYTGDDRSALLAGLSYLQDVVFDPVSDILVISDSDNHVIRGVFGATGVAEFAPAALGSTSIAQDTTLTDVGNLPLVLSGVQAPADFTVGGSDTTCTASTGLDIGEHCTIGIEFAPTADGSLVEQLVLTGNFNNAPASLQGVTLLGTGTGNAPAQLAFSGSIPTIAVGGNLGTVLVNVEDSSGNVVSAASSVVTLTITGPGGYSQMITGTAINGVVSFNLSSLPLTAAGSYTLTATSPGLTQAQAMASATGGGGNPATPVELAIPDTVPTSIVAGQSLGVVPVDIDNSSGTLVTGATNSVTMTITGPGGYMHSLTVTAVGGVANFDFGSLALTTPGTYTLTATSAGLVSATATFTVTAGNPTTPVQLAIASSIPSNLGSGGNLGTVVVDVNSSAGTVITAATNSVTLTITGPGGFSYTVTVTAVNGLASFDLSALALTTPGTYTLTAASGHLTSAIATFVVTVDFTIAVTAGTPGSSLVPPGAATSFNFTLAPVTGSFASPITVTATGMPAGATYSFSAATVTPGTSPVSTIMSLQTQRNGLAGLRTGPGTMALALLLLPIAAWRRARRSWRGAGLFSVLLPFLMLGAVAGLSGCGAGGLFGHPQTSYTITVTGTSGQISHSATVTLTVE